MTTTSESIGAIIGPGRSGTTWAGTLVDSCPDVVYRFEPFHRMAKVDAGFRDWMDKLKQLEVGERDLPRLYGSLVPAHPLTNKPPFFPEKSYSLRTFGRQQLWPMARVIPAVSSLYRAAYSPQPGPPLVFKEVTFLKPTRNLLERTSVPIVYMARHPCATVLSEVRGQARGKMPAARQQHLRKILHENAPEMADRFNDVLDEDDAIRRSALLWRFEVETSIPLVKQSRNGIVMTYEQLAGDTHGQARTLLAHFGLEYSAQTERFVDFLLGMDSAGQGARPRTGWGDRYFSVYRNPRLQKDAWKSRMSREDRRKVEEIVRDSPAFEYCATLGNWE